MEESLKFLQLIKSSSDSTEKISQSSSNLIKINNNLKSFTKQKTSQVQPFRKSLLGTANQYQNNRRNTDANKALIDLNSRDPLGSSSKKLKEIGEEDLSILDTRLDYKRRTTRYLSRFLLKTINFVQTKKLVISNYNNIIFSI